MTRNIDYAWFDHDLFEHRKIIRLLAAPGGEHLFVCWFRLVLWAHRHTDPQKPGDAGVIEPPEAQHVLGDAYADVLGSLAHYGLVEEMLDGWVLHDFAEHQNLAGWARRQRNARAGGIASGEARRTQSRTLGSANGSTDELNPPTQPNPTQRDQDLSSASASDFDKFYAAYPRHVAPKAARKAFDRAIRDTDPQVIIDGARRYADDCERTERPPGYIKHPATWLNKGCWDDADESEARRIPNWER